MIENDIFRALADPTRRVIFEKLAGGSMNHFFGRWVNGTDVLAPPDRLLASLPPAPTPPSRPRGLGAIAAFLEFGLGALNQLP